ncbi:MAG: class I SAM-dependent methyltransferase [Nitrospirae bacterium]|nr:class I SAM-dependent methyltransferase [Nitrospirota bacterium]
MTLITERVPEDELMDDAEQAAAYAETDFSEPHEAFVSYFRERFPDFRSGKVLDIGCGTGDVIIRFARALPGVMITGIDGADEMLKIARRDIERCGYGDRIKLMHCLLRDESMLKEKFDAVISNSILHHLYDPYVLWNTVKACAVKNAPVFIMDLFRPESAETAEALVRKHAAEASPVLKKDFYNSLLAAYTPEEIRSQIKQRGLGMLEVETVSDRHVIIWGRI